MSRNATGVALLLLALAGVSAFWPVASARADAPVVATPIELPVTTKKLPNGLEVVLHEDHRAPIATVNLWYRVGSKDEPPGRSGFAHLFEHVMFQGSKHVPEDTYFRYLERAGATDVNGTTHVDRTAYYETVPSNRLELALWLESDRMGFLLNHVDGQTFAVQRDVVKNEWRENYQDRPYGLVPQMIRAAVYPADHPYHHPTIGEPKDLDAATVADVRAFFKEWYVPNDATLVVAGDIEPKKTMALVEKYFGPIAPGRVPERQTAPAVALKGETRIEIRAGVALPRVYVTWVTPAFFAPGDGELDLVARVLASGKSSRLYKRLVYDLQIAQDVSALQASSELGSTFEVVATAQPGHTPAELLVAIDEEIARVRKDGVTDAELVRAKTITLSERVFEVEKDGSRANLFNMYSHYVGDPAYLAKDLARYENATAADVKSAAEKNLVANRVVAFVAADPKAPVGGALVKTTGAAP